MCEICALAIKHCQDSDCARRLMCSPLGFIEIQTIAVASHYSYFHVKYEFFFDLNIFHCVFGYSESCY